MTAKNVAIVWAPNLLRSKSLELGGVAALQGVGVQVREMLVSGFSIAVGVEAIVKKNVDCPNRFFSEVRNSSASK